MSLPRPFSAVPAPIAALLALAGCGGSAPRTPIAPLAPPSDEQQVRAVAKAIVEAYAAEDYGRLCAQFAPGTFTAVLPAVKVASCEDLFRKLPSFEAPSPQQVNAAAVRIRGDRATIDYREKGVDSTLLTRIDGRWLISNKAEVSG